MKCYYMSKNYLALFLCFISLFYSFSFALSSQIVNFQTVRSRFNEREAKFYARYAKMANCAEKPMSKFCKECLQPGDGYKFYFFYRLARLENFHYKVMIHYNDEEKKIIFSFGGPTVANHNYVKFIYSKGFTLIRRYRVNIEKEYAYVYFKKIQKKLILKILAINASGRRNHQLVFTGYSIGGSIATLAAFDLSRRKLVKDPLVYTYGSLRIGDATFVTLVNAYIRVWRIVKSNDYIVRIPSCYFSPSLKVWRCFTPTIIRKFIYKPEFPLKVYVRNYIALYRKSNHALMKVLARKKTPRVIKPRQRRKGRRGRKIDSHLSLRALYERKKKELEILKKKLLKELKKKKRMGKKKHYKKGKRNLRRQIKKKKNQMKKMKKYLKKSKRKTKNPDIILAVENLEKILKHAKAEELENLFKKPETFALFKNVPTEKALEIIKKLLKKYPPKVDPEITSVILLDQAKETLKKLAQVSSISRPLVTHSPHLYIPSVSEVAYLKPVQVYFKYIYYTQPIGYEIYYNENMTTFQLCEYIDGIANCERFVSLPNAFSVDVHQVYYDINFENCPVPGMI